MTASIDKATLKIIITEELKKHHRENLLEYDIGDAYGASYDPDPPTRSRASFGLVDAALGVLAIAGFVDPTQVIGLSATEALAGLILVADGDREGAAIVLATAPIVGGPGAALASRTARRLNRVEADEFLDELVDAGLATPSEARKIADEMMEVDLTDPAVIRQGQEKVASVSARADNLARTTREIAEAGSEAQIASLRSSRFSDLANVPAPRINRARNPRQASRLARGQTALVQMDKALDGVEVFVRVARDATDITPAMRRELLDNIKNLARHSGDAERASNVMTGVARRATDAGQTRRLERATGWSQGFDEATRMADDAYASVSRTVRDLVAREAGGVTDLLKDVEKIYLRESDTRTKNIILKIFGGAAFIGAVAGGARYATGGEDMYVPTPSGGGPSAPTASPASGAPPSNASSGVAAQGEELWVDPEWDQ